MGAQFSISAAVFDHTHPSNSRQSILNQFNQGLFDLLLVTDDSMDVDKEFMLIPADEDEPEPKEEDQPAIAEDQPEENQTTKAEDQPEPKAEDQATMAKDQPEPME